MQLLSRIVSAILLVSYSYTSISAQAPEVPVIPYTVAFAGISINLNNDARTIVEADVKNLMQNRKFWEDKLEKASIYFPVIEGRLIDEEVPIDFKYLAAQESGFNPDAFSSSSAVGYWQFKQESARELGLRVDDEIDERKSITSSTIAAARYLKRSNGTFNNWVSSLFSYYLGFNGVKSQIPQNWTNAREVSFTGSTDRYLLRFVAYKLAFETGLERYVPSNNTILIESTATKNKTLADISKQTGVAANTLREYNRWLIADRIPADRDYVLIVPGSAGNVASLREKIGGSEIRTVAASLTSNNGPYVDSAPQDELGYPVLVRSNVPNSNGYTFYEINKYPGILARPGDDAKTISQAGNLKSHMFLKYNDMSTSDKIIPGEVYYLARKGKKAATKFHTARPGESLQKISNIYGIRLKYLMKYNRLNNRNYRLETGRVMWLTEKRPRKTPVEIVNPQNAPASRPQETIAVAQPSYNNEAPTPRTEPTSPNDIPRNSSERKKYTPKLADNPAPKSEPVAVTPAPQKVIEAPDNTNSGDNSDFQSTRSSNNRVTIVDGNKQPVNSSRNNERPTANPSPAPASRNNAPTVTTTSGNAAEIAGARYHSVEKGQTYYSISRLFNISVDQLLKLNNLTTNDKLEVGQRIIVARGSGAPASVRETARPVANSAEYSSPSGAASSGTSSHKVAPGETLYSIARKYNLSVQDLARLNNLTTQTKVVVGQELLVSGNAPSAASSNPAPTRNTVTSHVVQRGETLFSVSKKYGVTIQEIIDANHLKSNSVQLGQKLKIPNQ